MLVANGVWVLNFVCKRGGNEAPQARNHYLFNQFCLLFYCRWMTALSCPSRMKIILSSWTFSFFMKRRTACGMVEPKPRLVENSSKIVGLGMIIYILVF